LLVEQLMPHCALHRHDPVRDGRGALIALEGGHEVPFDIARVYYLYDTPEGQARGFHAHKALQQWAVCVAGACTVLVDDGATRREVRLDSPDLALHIGPGIWREMRDFSAGAVMMVLASERYDEADYIRDYAAFRAAARDRSGG